ncbi:PREDICTED: transmembrane protein 79-like [Cyprinodon variegatus]|uniref:Transmembrane protein 79-like n=1 Tax=Cyprinodon variegatus TaxID=28743 RepID=A0A3Q2DA17_CYPVA|nr:PREDICTED: transmembrane protein 79-like [Cyprinodon variegatus]XP_015249385.1 PREDICTED: transmembrane protein 79-like [Cyprinodon variegatus]
MSTSELQATDRQNAEELDTVKESISDIINQLQDIDPTRLSFSPFLDLDTQISLAPVSDSPESSVEELRSASHSISGSQRSLGPPPVKEQLRSYIWCHQQPSANLPAPSGVNQTEEEEEEELDQTLSSPFITSHSLDATMENCRGPPLLASQGDIPNGTNTPRWSPESTNLESTLDEGRPLIGPTQESVELAVWTPEGLRETDTEAQEPPDQGRCCRCCQCKCSQSRLPAFFSVLASLMCAAGMLYALYFYVPIRPPDCPDVSSRIIFTFCCCTVAALPVVLAMLIGALCQFCSGSLSLQESTPRRHTLQQLFVTSSLEQLLLYLLNLVTMATLLNQEQLKLVPILVFMFIIGRLVFWFSLNTCSSWRGFGSGLSFFPLLAMVVLNLFLMYNLNLKQPLIGSQDALYNQVTPSSWSGETSQSPSGKPDVLPTDILDAQ